jgi:hypothetical protein
VAAASHDTATSTSTSTSTSGATALTTADVLAVFDRSCAGCHRHQGGDPAAVENGAYFDTEADIRRLMSSYGVGIAQSGLMTMLTYLERDGELRIGAAHELMPPEGSAQPPISRVEARQIRDWYLASQ